MAHACAHSHVQPNHAHNHPAQSNVNNLHIKDASGKIFGNSFLTHQGREFLKTFFRICNRNGNICDSYGNIDTSVTQAEYSGHKRVNTRS